MILFMHCRASPLPEVAKAAPELLRTLIYCNPPEWASNQHAPTATMHPDKRRLGTLAAIMALSPAAAPEAAISHMFSEHVDVSQRLLVLDSLCAAAHELAGRPLMQPLNAPGAETIFLPCTLVFVYRSFLWRSQLVRVLKTRVHRLESMYAVPVLPKNLALDTHNAESSAHAYTCTLLRT